MKKTVSLLIATSSVVFSFSQTVFWTESFNNGCTSLCLAGSYSGANGAWTVTNTGPANQCGAPTTPNEWYVSCAENGNAVGTCGTGCGNDATLHVGNIPSSPSAGIFCPPGDCGAAYDAGGYCNILASPPSTETDKRAESPTINCSGQSNITISFKYLENGQGTNDDATLWYYDGSTWSQIDPIAKSNNAGCAGGQGRWTAFSMLLPVSANNNPNVKIGFRWVNDDDGSGADPSFAVDEMQLSVPGGAAPIANFSFSATSICAGACVTFTDGSTNSPTSWSWNFQGGNPATSTNQNPCISYSASGTYTASLTATNANGSGSATQTITVTITSPPSANAGSDVTICQSASTTLNATGGGTYLWSPATGLSNPNISNPVASPTSSTNYSVTVTNSCGSNTDAVNVMVNPLPTANAGADVTVCPSATTILTATGGGTYAWNTGQTTTSISVSPTSTTTYSITVTNSCGSSTDDVNVVVSNNITATVSGNTTICSGQSTTLTASGGSNYSWNNSSTNNAIIVSPTSNTSYTVYVTSGTCADTVSVTVNITSPPVASISGNTSFCSGDSATLTASGGGNYSWSTGETTASITISSAGIYFVVVATGSCTDTDSVSVIVNTNPTAGVCCSDTVSSGTSATLTASGGGTYSWNNGSTSISVSVSPTVTTLYCVMVTNTNGCTDDSCVTVYVEQSDCSAAGELYIPNAFSPNGDLENDVLQAYYGNVLCIKSLSIKIFDRWGEKVFESDKIDFVWDGVFNGKRLNTEVFTYYLKAELEGGKTVDKKGNISLIR